MPNLVRPVAGGTGRPGLSDDGFAEFYQRTFAQVLSTTIMASGHRGDAEDAVQEAYVIALRRWPEVLGALATLPPPVRIALVMCAVLGWTQAEVAEVLQVPRNTIANRIFRGRPSWQPSGFAVLEEDPVGEALAGLYAVGTAVAAFNLVIVSLPILLYLALRHQLPAGKYSGALVAAASERVYAAEHPPVPVPSVPSFTRIPDLQHSLPKDLPSFSPTFLLPKGVPSDLIFSTVTVRPGDTLSLIACQYSTTVAALETLNHLGSSTTIKAGQRLTVPNPHTTTAACG